MKKQALYETKKKNNSAQNAKNKSEKIVLWHWELKVGLCPCCSPALPPAVPCVKPCDGKVHLCEIRSNMVPKVVF